MERREFIKWSNAMLLSPYLPTYLQVFDANGNNEFRADGLYGDENVVMKDDLLDLGNATFNVYDGVLKSIQLNEPLLKNLTTQTNQYSSLYNSEGVFSENINKIKQLHFQFCLFDFDTEISVTELGIQKLIGQNGYDNTTIDNNGDSLSIEPIAGTINLIYINGPFRRILVIQSKVKVFYSSNQSWLLTIEIPCISELVNNNLTFKLFSVPVFRDENNEVFDPFGFVVIIDRRDFRVRYIEEIRKLLIKFTSPITITNIADFQFLLKPKNIVVDYGLTVLCNSSGIIKSHPLTINPNYQKEYIIDFSNLYSNQLLETAFSTQFNDTGTTVKILKSSSPVAAYSGSLLVELHIAHYEERNVPILPDVEIRISVTLTYEMYFINNTNKSSILKGNLLQYSYNIEIDNIPPFYNADSDMNQIIEMVKAQINNDMTFSKYINTRNASYGSVALTFFNNGLQILLNK